MNLVRILVAIVVSCLFIGLFVTEAMAGMAGFGLYLLGMYEGFWRGVEIAEPVES